MVPREVLLPSKPLLLSEIMAVGDGKLLDQLAKAGNIIV